jgi:D-alanine-D-alanine ligase
MKMSKLRLGVLFGGVSGEHEVSLMSARSILSVLSPEKYEVIPIGITKQGQWVTGEKVLEALEGGDTTSLIPVTILPEPGSHMLYALRSIEGQVQLEPLSELDVIFPVLHGTFGEDGTVQGLLEVAGLAYVGAGVLASSVCMDKALCKKVLSAHGLPVVEWKVFTRGQIRQDMSAVIQQAEAISPYPLFVKPANLGSSVGITKCNNSADLTKGLVEAARYDRRVLVERGLNCPREIEVSVLGNENPLASLPGEIRPKQEFYTYDAKYYDNSTELLAPAPLSQSEIKRFQELAIEAYKATDCAGMARVDFLMESDNRAVYISEINTIPGFTRISMYPRLWSISGIPYQELVDRLLELALERKAENDQTERVFRRDG